VRLTDERWDHISRRHPEMGEQKARVLETVGAPDQVQEGDGGAMLAIRLYPGTPLTTKFLVVVYREISAEDGFVITSYFTTRPSVSRRVIWKHSES
ncbi:MAG: hypothetical protein ACREM1_11090, partial [Longimicrobiales bacterium]